MYQNSNLAPKLEGIKKKTVNFSSAKTQPGWQSLQGLCCWAEKSVIHLFHLTFLNFVIKGGPRQTF